MIEKKVRAPYFKLRNQNNEWVSLDDYKGQRIFIFFCGSINDLHTMTIIISYIKGLYCFDEVGVRVLGILGSSVEDLAEKTSELRIPFPLLFDEDQKVRKAYDVWKHKQTFGQYFWITTRSALIINEEGIVERTFKRINTEQYANPVIKYLEHKHHKDEWRKLSRRTKERIRREHEMSYKSGDYIGPLPRCTKTLE